MAITDTAAAGWLTPETRLEGLRAAARRWAGAGIELIQLREKALPSRELLELCAAMAEAIDGLGAATRVLVNGRADVACAGGADGVQLTSAPGELTPGQVRAVFVAAGRPAPFVSVSCHTGAEVARAREAGADAVVFGPVFEKRVAGRVVVEGTGLPVLRAACAIAGTMPVLALGGVTAENSVQCLSAGVAGIAAIRLFGG